MFKEHSVGTATMEQYDEAIKKELLEGIVFVAPFMDNNQRGLVTFEVDQYDLRENNKLLIHVSYYYAGSFTYVGHSYFLAHSLGDVDRDCQTRSSVENNRTRGRGLRNLHLDRLAIFSYCKVGDTSY